MARQRSKERDETMKKWLDSGGKISTKELAELYSVPESRIRKWKSEDKWTDKIPKKKKGGQKGNKNAVGNGAPTDNNNSIKHGIYKTIHLDKLPPHHKEYIESLTLNVEENLLRELQLLMAKRLDLCELLDKLNEDNMYVDRIVEMLVPSGANKEDDSLEIYRETLAELLVEESKWLKDLEVKTHIKKATKSLNKCREEIEKVKEEISNAESKGTNETNFTTTMKTIMSSSYLERRLKIESELNKVDGRIIKLNEVIKNYQLEIQRLELDTKRHELAEQKAKGVYEVEPDVDKR